MPLLDVADLSIHFGGLTALIDCSFGHAYVIRRSGSALTAEEVIGFCNGKLARYKWPKMVTFVKEFPRTSLGKVRKRLLSES